MELLKKQSKAIKDCDCNEEFKLSIEIARALGVPEDEIIKNEDDIDKFFTDA